MIQSLQLYRAGCFNPLGSYRAAATAIQKLLSAQSLTLNLTEISSLCSTGQCPSVKTFEKYLWQVILLFQSEGTCGFTSCKRLTVSTETHLSVSSHTAASGALPPHQPCTLSVYLAAHPLMPFTFQSETHLHKRTYLPSGISGFSHTHLLVSRAYEQNLHAICIGIRL